MHINQILVGIWVVVNVVSFLVMANDKRKSTKGVNAERIPEGLIFFMATIFGSVGVYAGMIIFRHKTKRWYFQLGIPLLIIQNIATLYLLRDMFLVS